VYYGGHQAAMLRKGEHPLRANAVSILNMKKLTEEHQPARDSGRCVILHEIAHAVHHQLIGYENASIKAAFQQAMERKLYDKDMYAATNEREFFAELTCAYLNKLNYYPRTRQDLRKHDPVTYKLMETIWGEQKTAKGKGDQPASEFTLDVTVDKVQLGDTLLGSQRGVQRSGVVARLDRPKRAFERLHREPMIQLGARPFDLLVPVDPEKCLPQHLQRFGIHDADDGLQLQLQHFQRAAFIAAVLVVPDDVLMNEQREALDDAALVAGDIRDREAAGGLRGAWAAADRREERRKQTTGKGAAHDALL